MPGGKVHSAITIATVSGILAPYAMLSLKGDPYLYVAGCLSGLLITPDLDVDKGNISDSILRKIFPPIQTIWRTFWFPYAKVIPHRSPLSHFPLLGTLLRIGYIFLVINLVSVLSHLIFDTVSHFYFLWNWWFFLGLCHVDVCHYLADLSIKGKETFEES